MIPEELIREPIHVICRCGAIIPDEDIEKINGSNEEGEDYGEVSAYCEKCGTEYETMKWGEWDDLEEAKSVLHDYISG